MTRDPRIGRRVHLRHVKGRREVTRALDGTPGTVVAVWKYHGGLVRIHVMIDDPKRGRPSKLTLDEQQVDWRPR